VGSSDDDGEVTTVDDDWDSPAPADARNAIEIADHDRTTIGTGEDRIVPGDQPAGSSNDPLAVLRAGGDTIPLTKERELVQPEHSPLAFVMGETARTQSSNDSSRFVMSLVGGAQPSLPVAEDVGVITAMEPAPGRARRRRTWIVAGVLAAGTVAGTTMAMVGSSDKAPAKQTAAVIEPAPAAVPQANAVAQDPPVAPPVEPVEPSPAVVPIEAEAEPEVVAVATTTKPATITKSTTTKTKTKASSKRPATTTTKKPVKTKAVAKSSAKKAPTKTTAKKPAAKKGPPPKKPVKKTSTTKSSR
jgi:hypothetical protein